MRQLKNSWERKNSHPFDVQDGKVLQWHPGNIIDKLTIERTEDRDFNTILAFKWIRTTNLTTIEKVSKLLDIVVSTH